MNEFLEMINEILIKIDEEMLADVEDLDELDEVCDIESYSIDELMKMSINPLFIMDKKYGLCKRGIKSKDWIKISLSEIEKRLIVNELSVGRCY